MGCGSPVTPAAAGVQQIRTVFGVTRGLPGRSPAWAAATTLAGWTTRLQCDATNQTWTSVAAGNGKWGQSDLVGSVWEWHMDYHHAPFVSLCDNCGNFTTNTYRMVRGGGFLNGAGHLSTPWHNDFLDLGGSATTRARAAARGVRREIGRKQRTNASYTQGLGAHG